MLHLQFGPSVCDSAKQNKHTSSGHRHQYRQHQCHNYRRYNHQCRHHEQCDQLTRCHPHLHCEEDPQHM